MGRRVYCPQVFYRGCPSLNLHFVVVVPACSVLLMLSTLVAIVEISVE